VIVRPFFDGDVDVLEESFSDWVGDGMPCEVIDGVPTHPPVDMILYYARSISNGDANTTTTSASLDIVRATAAAINASTAEWRVCIGEIVLLGANLTETEDVYDPSASQVNWNRGPNLQVRCSLACHLPCHTVPTQQLRSRNDN
jgi:hypothetical protein